VSLPAQSPRTFPLIRSNLLTCLVVVTTNEPGRNWTALPATDRCHRVGLGATCTRFAYVYLALPQGDGRANAQRAIAALLSFRFFGFDFPRSRCCRTESAVGLCRFRRLRPLFWMFVVALNLVDATDIIGDYCHGTVPGLADSAGQGTGR